MNLNHFTETFMRRLSNLLSAKGEELVSGGMVMTKELCEMWRRKQIAHTSARRSARGRAVRDRQPPTISLEEYAIITIGFSAIVLEETITRSFEFRHNSSASERCKFYRLNFQ